MLDLERLNAILNLAILKHESGLLTDQEMQKIINTVRDQMQELNALRVNMDWEQILFRILNG